MILYPAVDLLQGEVVRLEKGDFSKLTRFERSPEAWFEFFESIKISAVHLVDLSGAQDPSRRQNKLLKSLLMGRSFRLQVGGGVRTLSDIESLISAGADRVVLGSVLFQNPNMVLEAARIWGAERFTLALDVIAKNEIYEVMTQAWSIEAGQDVHASISFWIQHGFRRFLCTDISRDGMMSGPNLQLYQKLKADFPNLEFQASGGVSSLSDLQELHNANLHSAVVGRSFLSGRVSLEEALSIC